MRTRPSLRRALRPRSAQRGQRALAELDLAGEDGRRCLGIDRIQASSMRFCVRLPGRGAACCVSASFGSIEKATTIAPMPAANSRRVAIIAFMLRSFRLTRRLKYRSDDPPVGAAAAKIAIERGADIGLRRFRSTIEECLRGHDHAVDAIAALRGLLLNKCALQRMQASRWCRGPRSSLSRCRQAFQSA